MEVLHGDGDLGVFGFEINFRGRTAREGFMVHFMVMLANQLRLPFFAQGDGLTLEHTLCQTSIPASLESRPISNP